MAFLRNLLATILGLFLFSVLFFFLFIGIASVASTEETPTIKEHTVLYFPMNGVVAEIAVEDPILEVFKLGEKVYSLIDLILALNTATNDERIKGIYLEPGFLVASSSSMQELRDALLKFKETGKFIYAYGEFVGEQELLITSLADEFILNPTAGIEFNGMSVNITFFKGLFDKLEIQPEIFRVGEFKSAVEPFMRKELSEENKMQYTELLNSIYGFYLKNLSESTGKSVEELSKTSDNMDIILPEDAVNYGLATQVGYKNDAKTLVKRALGKEADSKLNMMKLSSYVKALATERKYSKNKIAVIVAQGEIVMSGDEGIVGKEFVKEIKQARESESVKAVVLRINSPGGSLTASDLIWNELMLTKEVKPVIASMGGVAASGGYYIAMPADTIVAQPNTITGSIGIFGYLFNFSEFLENKVGITNEVVKTGKYSDIFTATRPLNDVERAIIQKGVNYGYEVFTSKAAEGRGMSIDEVKAVAGGRVWSGEQAFENGLVDVLGSFNDAVAIAAQAAGVEDDYRLRFYPQQKTFIEELLSKIEHKARVWMLGEKLTETQKQINKLKKIQGIQALMPGELVIE